MILEMSYRFLGLGAGHVTNDSQGEKLFSLFLGVLDHMKSVSGHCVGTTFM